MTDNCVYIKNFQGKARLYYNLKKSAVKIIKGPYFSEQFSGEKPCSMFL